MTLIAAWGTLLGRLSGQQDVVIGVPTANRGRPEIEQLIGFFVNTLAVRLDLSDSPTVSELLARVKMQVLAALKHQDIPFEQVVELANPARSLAYNPVFQVMFAWENNKRGKSELPGLELTHLQSPPQNVAKFDLTLFLNEAGKSIVGGIEFATALFEPLTIERYLGYFHNLLDAMVADDAQFVDRIPILPSTERHQLLYAWNDTKADYPGDKCVHQLFEEQVAKTPNAVAVDFEEQELTYAELNRKANQLAHYLRELGVRPDDRVALCAERGFEMIVALMAVLKAGGAYIPLDPAYPQDRLHFMLQDSEPVALLTQRHLARLFADSGTKPPMICLDEEAAAWQGQSTVNLSPASIGLTPQHLVYVIYTSGSAGSPKGVMVQHQNLASSNFARKRAYGEFGRFLLLSPISFDSSVAGIFGTLTNAGTLLIATHAVVRDPYLLNDEIRRLRVESLLCVPSLYQQLLNYCATPEHEQLLFRVIVAGEQCPPSLVAKSAQKNPLALLFNEYGPTEGTVWASVYRCVDQSGKRSVPIGRPIANTRIYILDRQKQPLPVGVAGELYIGGAGVARGYLNQPELTAERFLADPFVADPEARMYKTGDLGRWLPDGNIEFLGRNDFQVKIRGFRIELGEIEARLIKVKGIGEAVVVVREDDQGDKQLVAYFTATDIDKSTTGEKQEFSVNAQELRSHLLSILPEYMVPRAYVRLAAMPITPNGKLDRNALPAPDNDEYSTRGYEVAQGEVEVKVASVWAELLNVDKIGRYDNFFELGGHSLTVVRLVHTLRDLFSVDVTIRHVLEHPILAELAEVLARLMPQCAGETEFDDIDRPVLVNLGRNRGTLPVFMCHCGSGELDYIPRIVPFVDRRFRVYGLPAKPVGAEQPRSLEEMADRMVQMIRLIQTDGPYRIAGWCIGGTIGYEIARRLAIDQQPIEFLGLIDSHMPGDLGRNILGNFGDFEEKEDLLIWAQAEAPATVEAQRCLDAIKVKANEFGFAELVGECRSMNVLPERFGNASSVDIRAWLARTHVIRIANSAYSPVELSIPVHLFSAASSKLNDQTLGWKAIMPEHLLRIHLIPGSHASIMRSPDIEILGKMISDALIGCLERN